MKNTYNVEVNFSRLDMENRKEWIDELEEYGYEILESYESYSKGKIIDSIRVQLTAKEIMELVSKYKEVEIRDYSLDNNCDITVVV